VIQHNTIDFGTLHIPKFTCTASRNSFAHLHKRVSQCLSTAHRTALHSRKSSVGLWDADGFGAVVDSGYVLCRVHCIVQVLRVTAFLLAKLQVRLQPMLLLPRPSSVRQQPCSMIPGCKMLQHTGQRCVWRPPSKFILCNMLNRNTTLHSALGWVPCACWPSSRSRGAQGPWPICPLLTPCGSGIGS
jgi:hypothetical protein